MSDPTLALLSTLAWIIGTSVTFVLLAHWSAGGSWGISAALARGLIGWAGRDPTVAGGPATASDLRPMATPRLDRLWAGTQPGAAEAAAATGPTPPTPNAAAGGSAIAEIEDLGSRPI